MATDPTAPQLATDVRSRADGQWLATCECGRGSVQRDERTAWSWVLDHGCAQDD